MSITNPGEPQDRWFGTGEVGFFKMFAVWGESEPKNVARVPFRRAHTGTLAGPDGKRDLNRAVLEVLADPIRPRRLVDPRELFASQHAVTWSGVNYYLHKSRYGRTGWTWAEQSSRINREVVVWSSPQQGPVLLSGHHRTVVSLLRGEPLDAVWVEFDDRETGTKDIMTPPAGDDFVYGKSTRGLRVMPLDWDESEGGSAAPGASATPLGWGDSKRGSAAPGVSATPLVRGGSIDRPTAPGTRVTQLVWVGDCPYLHQRAGSANVAESLVRGGTRCVLPSVSDAEHLLLLLGAGQRWVDSVITFATTGRLA